MKRITYFIFIAVIVSMTTTVFSQIDRTKKPPAGAPPKASFPDYSTASLKNKLKVFIVEDHDQPLVTFRLLFKSGSEFDGDKSGLANFTCDLLTKGTTKRSSTEFAKETDFIGANIGAGSADDYMSMSGSGLKKHMDKILVLFTDALFNPIFSQEELEKARKQALSGLTYSKSDPNSLLGNLQITLAFNKHPYSNFEKEKTLKAVTRDDVVKFHNMFFIPNNATLAVVGDVTSKEIVPVLERYFGSWTKGTVPASEFPQPDPIKGVTVHIVDRQGSVQSNIAVLRTGMKRNNKDFVHLSVVNSLLGGGFSGRLFQNLREKHGFTYGAYSSLDTRKMAGSFNASADVRKVATDSAITEILHEMKRLQTEPVTDKELTLQKDYLSGNYLLSLENAGTTASRVQNIDLYGLPGDYFKNYVNEIQSVSFKQVQELAKKYLAVDNIAIAVVGDAKELKPKLEKFGPVTVYNTDIEPVIDKPTGAIDLTAGQVIEKHIAALGGREAIMAIKDRTSEGTLSIDMGGQSMSGKMLQIEKAPNKVYQKISFPMGAQEQWVDGTHAVKTMGPQAQTLEGEELETALEEAQLFDALRFEELGFKAVIKDKKDVDGEMSYAVEVTKKSGKVETRYFNATTFMLIKDEKTEESPRGSMTVVTKYGDYKSVNGVMMPHLINPNPGVELTIKIESYKVNTNVDDSVFVRK